MTKKMRYLLLAAGFVVFMTVAPLIIFFVLGVRYDLADRDFIQTGILAATIDPKDAKIFINNELKKNGSGSVKFLNPGEYQVDIKKDGYFDWSKRLTIKANEVTWANSQTDKLNMFYSDPKKTPYANNASDFAIAKDFLYYLTPSNLVVQNLDSSNTSQNYPLPKNSGVDRLIVSPNGGRIALQSSTSSKNGLLLLDSGSKNFEDLRKFVSATTTAEFAFSSDNSLFVQNGTQLLEFTTSSLTPMVFAKKVEAFSVQSNGIYMLQTQSSSTDLTLNFSDFAGNNFQELATDIPGSQNPHIIVTPQRQIFILAGESLYKVNVSLDKIADGVTEWSMDPVSGDISFLHQGEMDYYSVSSQQTIFITRTTLPMGLPQLNTSVGYAFFFKDKNLTGIELDNREHQNEYIFYRGQNPEKLFMNSDATQAFVLDNGQIIELKIR